MQRVTYIEAPKNYRLKVRFSDGMEGVVDLSEMVGKGVCTTWSDPGQFARAFVDETTHTVAWPNGIDLCPDALYEEIAEQQEAA